MDKRKILLIPDSNVFYYLNSIRSDDELFLVVRLLVIKLNIFKVWLSKEVKREVPDKYMKRIERAFREFIPVDECPIKDRNLSMEVRNECQIHIGEADCIMQVIKVTNMNSETRNKLGIAFLNPGFLTNDHDALNCKYVLTYSISWKTLTKEILVLYGISIPH